MKIIEMKYNWSGLFGERNRTEEIIIHHRSGSGSAQSLHSEHLANGWAGIGYHFYIKKDGSIYRGRPLNAVGAHCIGRNAISIGICFEGNYQSEKTMPEAQFESGKELVSYLKGLFPNATTKSHSDCIATMCPGRYFPLEEILKATERKELTSANDIIWELMNGKLKVQIFDVDRAVEELDKAREKESSLYWILRKIVNKEGQ